MDQTTTIVAAALAVAVVALAVALAAHRKLASARRSLTVLQGNASGKTLLDAVAGYAGNLRRLEDELETLGRRQHDLSAALSRSPRRIGMVRYDAFEDMGGRMSFSAAIVDDRGSGLVLTSINGRTEARTYAKIVDAGQSEHNLSPEEKEAIAQALGEKTKVRRER